MHIRTADSMNGLWGPQKGDWVKNTHREDLSALLASFFQNSSKHISSPITWEIATFSQGRRAQSKDLPPPHTDAEDLLRNRTTRDFIILKCYPGTMNLHICTQKFQPAFYGLALQYEQTLIWTNMYYHTSDFWRMFLIWKKKQTESRSSEKKKNQYIEYTQKNFLVMNIFWEQARYGIYQKKKTLSAIKWNKKEVVI